MRGMLIVAGCALLLALAWGFCAGAQPAPPRAHDQTIAATDAWRAALPRDPAAATQAYHDRIPPEMRARGEAVSNTRYFVFGARVLVSLGAMALFLWSGAAMGLAARLSQLTRRRWLQDAGFTAVLFLLLWLIALPIDVGAGYVRPRVFGFADRPFLAFLIDDFLNCAPITAFYAVGVVAFMKLLRTRPQSWVGWAGVIYLGLALVYVTSLPAIEGLTNHYTSLPDSPIKQDILSMARANGVPASDVFTGDASRQSRLLNAHVSGLFGTARISVDDTTLNGQDPNGIRWVVAHEMGHYVMGHVLNAVLVIATIGVIGFAFIAWLGPALIGRYVQRWRITDLSQTAGIAVFWLLFVTWGFVSDPALNAYSRWQESQADIFGLNASQAPDGMAEFMIHDADTQRLTPTPLDVFLFYDHPSDRARVEAAMRWRAEHVSN